MARLKLFDNIFEENFREVEIDINKPLIEQIEELNDYSYASDMVECYDTETGETYYAPFVEDDEQSVVITVNGQSVTEDYKPEETDIIEVVFLPLSSRSGSITAGVVIGGLLGLAVGGLIGWGIGAAAGSLIPGITVAGAIINGGILGLGIGGFAGGLIGASIWDKDHITSKKEGKAMPDVRGSSNQTLTNNCYPFVIGKHLVTPSVVGAPYTEYSGDNGEDAYIRELLCVGYGPLKLTDFKLGDTILAYNRTQKVERNTILKGLLKGHGDEDSGDILNVWKNNDVEIEIIQQSEDSLWRGNIYPETVKDTEVNTPILYVCDKNLEDVANITYKGTSFPSNFKTNTIKFTERCTKKFKVTLDFPNGLYSSHTNDSGDIIYERIPMWLAVQWRIRDKNNNTSDPNGSDYDLWNNITIFNGKDLSQVYTKEEYEADKDAHKGNDFSNLDKIEISDKSYVSTKDPMNIINTIKDSKYDNKRVSNIIINYDVKINGISIFSEKDKIQGIPLIPSKTYYSGSLIKNETGSNIIYDAKSKALYVGITTDGSGTNLKSDLSNSFISYQLSKETNIPLYDYTDVLDIFDSINKGRNTADGKNTSVAVKYILVTGKYYEQTIGKTEGYAGNWLNKTLVNFDKEGLWTGSDHISQMRAVAEIELTDEQIEQMMNTEQCPTNSVEVRVIRVSPSYLNENTKKKDNEGVYSYSDVTKWLSLTSYVFNEDKYQDSGVVEPLYAIDDIDLKQFCYIAVKAKADNAGYITGSIDKLNCIAESFSPYWDTNLHRWVPENVNKKTEYYGYWTDNTKTVKCDRGNDVYEEQVSKIDFETARGEGYNWYLKECGSDYFEKVSQTVLNPVLYTKDNKKYWDSETVYEADIKTDIQFNSDGTYTHNNIECILLSPIAERYNNNSVASGFMLASVGPQNGRGSLAYENLNLLSVSDLAEFGEDVTDGSTYARDTWVGGIKHLKGETVHFRFEANAYIYQQSKLEDILANIAVCGRSVYTYDEIGRIKIIIDRPVDYSVGVISQQNCISGSNNFDFTDNFAGYQIQYPDEDNGYENGLFYCWADGNSLKNYKGQVTPLSLAFVTNSNQAWSLGRYAAACAILQKNVLTRKIGREGCTFNIGDVLEVQSEELLIGNDSGRIQQILEVNGKVAGFITDATYEYSGKKKDGKVIQGVSILQPQRFGSDRVKTLRLAEKNTQIECNNEFYTLKKGVTNLVLFEEPVNFSDSGFYFNPGDTVLFGEYGKVSEKYRIIKTKPESDKTYTQTLIPYLSELYNYGDKLPVFHPAITEPEVARDVVSLSEVPVNIKEFKESMPDVPNDVYTKTEIDSKLEGLEDDIVTPPPAAFSEVSLMGIQVNCQSLTTVKQSIRIKYHVTQIGQEIDFTFGDIECPEGFSVQVSNKTHELIFTIESNVIITSGSITVPLIFAISKTGDIYVDSLDPETMSFYVDSGDGQIAQVYGKPVFEEDVTTYYMNLGYIQVKGGRYLGPINDEALVPKDSIVGDYFCFTGETTTRFKQTSVYSWTGNSWVEDSSTELMAGALSDILSVGTDILSKNNSTADLFLNRLVTNDAYIKKLVVTDGAFLNALSTKSITIGDDKKAGLIKSWNFEKGKSGWQIKGDGSAEFSDVTVRGNIEATSFSVNKDSADDLFFILSDVLDYGESTFDVSVRSINIRTNSEHEAMADEYIGVRLFAKRNDIKFQIQIGESKDLPAGFTLEHNGNILYIKVLAGTKIIDGKFTVPVSILKAVSGVAYADDSENSENDEEQTGIYYISGDVEYDTVETKDVTISYFAVDSGKYFGSFDSVSMLPTSVFPDDYFVWAGEDGVKETVKTQYSSREITLYKGAIYTWDGTSWVISADTTQMANCLDDLLVLNREYLEQNNSPVVSFFDNIVANGLFVDKLVANEGFIKNLGATNLVIDGGSISSSNFSKDSSSGFFLGTQGEENGLFIANNAIIRGEVYATKGTFVGDVEAKSLKLGDTNITNIVQSLDGYAKNDDVATYVNQNAISEVTQAESSDGSSIITVKKDGKTTEYKVVDTADYLYFGKDYGTQSADHKKSYTKISKEGLLTTNNALIYGTVYATDGEFTGTVHATDGEFTGTVHATDGEFRGNIEMTGGFLKANDTPFKPMAMINLGYNNDAIQLTNSKNVSSIIRQEKGVYTIYFTNPVKLATHVYAGNKYIDVFAIGNAADTFDAGFTNPIHITPNWLRQYVDGRLTVDINGIATVDYIVLYFADNDYDQLRDPISAQCFIFGTESD